MGAASITADANANGPARARAYQNTQDRVLISAVMRTAHRLWPRKTALTLSDRARVSPRSVERWQQDKGSLSADALAHLIRSEEGFEFLCAVMENHKPRWWRLVQPFMAIADAQAALRRAILKGARDAEQDHAAALARAAAHAVHDPQFTSPYLAALDATTGVSGRALAAPTKGKPR